MKSKLIRNKLKEGRSALKEKDIQKMMLEYLWLKRIFCWKHQSGGIAIDGGKRFVPMSLQGISDIIGILPDGKFLAIEVKRPGGKVSVYQDAFLKTITANGGLAFVAYNLEDLKSHGL